MARSIHTTRRELADLKRQQYADEKQQEIEVKHREETLAKKRRIKKQGTAQRGEKAPSIPTQPEQISICTVDTGRHIHYPASPSDIQAVLQLLPAGVLDGLDAIELRLRGVEKEPPSFEPDPFVGRPGDELLPGVYVAEGTGCYLSGQARIWLFAFVYDPDLPDREMWECYLRFYALGTLVHEVAHHYDEINRVARGRWRADDEEHVEHYARMNQFTWTRDIVIPYLEQTYPEHVQQLMAWLEYRGGQAIPLSALVDEPGSMSHGQRTYSFNALFSLTNAVEELAKDVADGKPREATRLAYARNLHYHEDYAPALEIIADLLTENPGNLEALTLQADIYTHQERYHEAEQIALQVVAADAEYEKAWKVLADVYQETREAEKLLQTVNQVIQLIVKGRCLPAPLIFRRALAELWLGDVAGYRADVALLEGSKPVPRFFIRRLREEEEKAITNQST